MDPIDIIAQTHDDGPRGIVTRGTAKEIVRRLNEAGWEIIRQAPGSSLVEVALVDPEQPAETPAPKKRAKKAEASE